MPETCVHHWAIESEMGEDRRLHGRCRLCGAEGDWPPSLATDTLWNASLAQMGAKHARKRPRKAAQT